MPEKSPKPCTRCGTPTRHRSSKCDECLRKSRTHTDQRRGTAAQRGYNRQHDNVFRTGVFELHGTSCVAVTELDPPTRCGRTATHADHYPKSRRRLEREGLDPNDPQYGRPLCAHHHNQATGRTQGPLAKRNPT